MTYEYILRQYDNGNQEITDLFSLRRKVIYNTLVHHQDGTCHIAQDTIYTDYDQNTGKDETIAILPHNANGLRYRHCPNLPTTDIDRVQLPKG